MSPYIAYKRAIDDIRPTPTTENNESLSQLVFSPVFVVYYVLMNISISPNE
ncbi:hypothetical protein GXM_06080 [Nostoc sphaeroides CCNUC1]|uniref:Uncharacterized protein n=1 Tax=Nostoc sphaeroides CCNUC1 TaxID=2653204 RepID=A0A5P8W8R5_9NOSO|nr:hypothetical protein GXM_06080 [Nostoc sphaeroides CCNUC1]